MKKVLIFSLAYYPNEVSGAEAAIREITDRISSQDIEFHLVTLRYDSALLKQEKIANVLVHRIGLTKKNPSFEELGKLPLDLNKPLYQFLAASKARSLHKKHHYDAIWAVMAHSAGVPAAIFKTMHPEVKYLLTLQEGDTIGHIEKTMKPLWPLFTRAFTKADLVQPISNHLLAWAKKRGVDSKKIRLIRNGANPRDLLAEVSEADILSTKEKLGKKERDIFLINTARLVNQKANDETIRALLYLPEAVHLVLVGEGPEQEKLENLAQELHLSERVIFVGRVSREEVTKYRLACDIFVGPSRSEGLGNAFLSAMASRLPVVATQEGGLADFIFDEAHNPEHAPTAWVVSKNSPEQIAQAVQDILADKNKVKKVTDNARQMVEEKYNWDKIAQSLKEIFLGF